MFFASAAASARRATTWSFLSWRSSKRNVTPSTTTSRLLFARQSLATTLALSARLFSEILRKSALYNWIFRIYCRETAAWYIINALTERTTQGDASLLFCECFYLNFQKIPFWCGFRALRRKTSTLLCGEKSCVKWLKIHNENCQWNTSRLYNYHKLP